jgi:hypothetical protein
MTATIRSFVPLVLLAGIILGVRPVAAAENEKAAPAPPDAKTDAADRSLREQDIYIPYEKLRQVFEKHGRGVFLPYEEFDVLWRAAQDKTRPAAEPHPPVGAVITEIENEATVSGDIVQVKAQIKIDLLTEGWHEVPLRLADASIIRATVKGDPEGAPARILGGNPMAGRPVLTENRLLVEKKGKQPESIELDLEYAKAITRSPGQNSVSIETPRAPVSRWRVRIPQAGVKVNLQPLLAATEEPAANAKPQADETVILAFLGASPTVRIEWTPKAEGATGLSALASVQAEQQVWVQEGVVRVRSNLAYTISRAELGQLAVEVPGDYKVVNVFDPNVRRWSVEAGGAGSAAQRITVQLFEPAKASQQVTVELEKIGGKNLQDKGPQGNLTVPVVKALGVGRQQGFVVVQVGSGLRAEAVRSTGLLQVDAGELPRSLASGAPSGSWAFAYRYAAVPFELELGLEEVQPQITVDSLVEARLEANRLTIDLTAVYTIERAGVFRLELDRPEGFEVRQVRGREIPGAAGTTQSVVAVIVQSHHLEGEKQDRLVVNLARKATGRVALAIEFQKDLAEPKLLVPSGQADIPLGLPQVRAGTVDRASGRLVIYAPESLRVNAPKAEGLRAVSLAEALEGMPWAQQNKRPASGDARADLKPALPFTFTQEPVVLRLAAGRREPIATVRQLLVARIEDGRIRYQSTVYYSILYSGVKSLRIDVPADAAASLHNTSGMQDKRLDPQPADVRQGMVAWSLSGASELLGEGKIELVWEKDFGNLDVGKSIDLVVQPLVPRGVNTAWGQVVLAKAETLDVHETGETEGLQPIDPQHNLMTEVPDGVRAFQFAPGFTGSLPITVTRYALEEMKRTSIDRAVVRMVLTPGEQVTAVQALYRIRSARQRLAMALPEKAEFDADPAHLNGQSITLEKDEKTARFFVPLPTAAADEHVLLELRYTVPGGRPLELPRFLDEPAVQEVYLCVFIPETQALLGTSGPWNEEFQWICPDMKWLPYNRIDDSKLVPLVREGVKDAGASADSFHTDGTQYVFSTLRPPPEGTLVVRTMDRRGLAGLVFAVVLLAGLVLVPAAWTRRVLAVGGLIVLLVLSGVFLPTLARQVFGGAFWSATVIVLVVWLVVFLFRLRRTMAKIREAMTLAYDRAMRRPVAATLAEPAASEGDPGNV